MRLLEGTKWDRPPHCEQCGELEEQCTCPPPQPQRIPPEKQTAKLSIEKRKKGKVVTLVQGLDAEGNDLPKLLSELKGYCGAGGTLKDGEIEIQGRQIDKVREKLAQIGYRVKG